LYQSSSALSVQSYTMIIQDNNIFIYSVYDTIPNFKRKETNKLFCYTNFDPKILDDILQHVNFSILEH
jgi:hypothetical protein